MAAICPMVYRGANTDNCKMMARNHDVVPFEHLLHVQEGDYE